MMYVIKKIGTEKSYVVECVPGRYIREFRFNINGFPIILRNTSEIIYAAKMTLEVANQIIAVLIDRGNSYCNIYEVDVNYTKKKIPFDAKKVE